MNSKNSGWSMAVAGVLALGLGVAGCAGGGTEQATDTATEAVPALASEVTIEVTDAGFVPAVVNVPKGQPATLVVTRRTAETCATEMVFAHNKEKHDLPLDQTVRIELPADRPETIDYACAMDMIKGQIVSK